MEETVDGRLGVRSTSGADCEVEKPRRPLEFLRLHRLRVNALGTGTHIEAALAAFRRGRARAFRAATAQGSSRIEIFLDRRGEPAPATAWPTTAETKSRAKAREWLRPWLDENGALAGAARILATTN